MTSSPRINKGPAAAAANRAALLAAARDVFSSHGANAPMSLIQNTAGVSPGVLYRHFPTRDSIRRAVFDEDIAALEALAAQPGTDLRAVLRAFLDRLVDSTAFVSTIRADEPDPAHAVAEQRVGAILTQKLEADRSGLFHPGVGARQLMLALALIAALLTKTPEPSRRAVAEEAWQLIMDGLAGASGS